MDAGRVEPECVGAFEQPVDGRLQRLVPVNGALQIVAQWNHERSAPPAASDQTFGVELPVRQRDRAGVDPELPSQLAHRRQPVVRREHSAGDEVPDLMDELLVHGHVIVRAHHQR